MVDLHNLLKSTSPIVVWPTSYQTFLTVCLHTSNSFLAQKQSTESVSYFSFSTCLDRSQVQFSHRADRSPLPNNEGGWGKIVCFRQGYSWIFGGGLWGDRDLREVQSYRIHLPFSPGELTSIIWGFPSPTLKLASLFYSPHY